MFRDGERGGAADGGLATGVPRRSRLATPGPARSAPSITTGAAPATSWPVHGPRWWRFVALLTPRRWRWTRCSTSARPGARTGPPGRGQRHGGMDGAQRLAVPPQPPGGAGGGEGPGFTARDRGGRRAGRAVHGPAAPAVSPGRSPQRRRLGRQGPGGSPAEPRRAARRHVRVGNDAAAKARSTRSLRWYHEYGCDGSASMLRISGRLAADAEGDTGVVGAVLRLRDGAACRFPGRQASRGTQCHHLGPLGRRRSHRPLQPGHAVPGAPPPDPRPGLVDGR